MIYLNDCAKYYARLGFVVNGVDDVIAIHTSRC